MVYKLDPKIRPLPLLPWIYVFSSLSIKQFSQVYEELDFPFDPPEDVRQLAHDFTLTLQTMSRNSEHATLLENLLRNGETVSVNLLEGTLADDPYEKQCDVLFTNTFAHLQRMGYAEAVYQWGKQTYTYYKYADRERRMDLDSLDDWCHLLTKWAVLEWRKQPLSPEQVPDNLYSIGWDEFVAKNAHFYTKSTLEPVPLLPASRATLQAIVLHHETKKLNLKTIMDQILVSPRNSRWEEFALGPGGGHGSITREGRLRLNLRQWQMIVDALSADDMRILGEWALKDTYKWRHLKVPLPDFRASGSSESAVDQ